MKTLKIYFTVLFAALSTVTAFAHDFEVNGIYYNKNAEWNKCHSDLWRYILRCIS